MSGEGDGEREAVRWLEAKGIQFDPAASHEISPDRRWIGEFWFSPTGHLQVRLLDLEAESPRFVDVATLSPDDLAAGSGLPWGWVLSRRMAIALAAIAVAVGVPTVVALSLWVEHRVAGLVATGQRPYAFSTTEVDPSFTGIRVPIGAPAAGDWRAAPGDYISPPITLIATVTAPASQAAQAPDHRDASTDGLLAKPDTLMLAQVVGFGGPHGDFVAGVLTPAQGPGVFAPRSYLICSRPRLSTGVALLLPPPESSPVPDSNVLLTDFDQPERTISFPNSDRGNAERTPERFLVQVAYALVRGPDGRAQRVIDLTVQVSWVQDSNAGSPQWLPGKHGGLASPGGAPLPVSYRFLVADDPQFTTAQIGIHRVVVDGVTRQSALAACAIAGPTVLDGTRGDRPSRLQIMNPRRVISPAGGTVDLDIVHSVLRVTNGRQPPHIGGGTVREIHL